MSKLQSKSPQTEKERALNAAPMAVKKIVKRIHLFSTTNDLSDVIVGVRNMYPPRGDDSPSILSATSPHHPTPHIGKLNPCHGVPKKLADSWDWAKYINPESISQTLETSSEWIQNVFDRYALSSTKQSEPRSNNNFNPPSRRSNFNNNGVGQISDIGGTRVLMTYSAFVNFCFDHGLHPIIPNDIKSQFEIVKIFLSGITDINRGQADATAKKLESKDVEVVDETPAAVDSFLGWHSHGTEHEAEKGTQEEGESEKVHVDFNTQLRMNCKTLRKLWRNMSSVSRKQLRAGLEAEVLLDEDASPMAGAQSLRPGPINTGVSIVSSDGDSNMITASKTIAKSSAKATFATTYNPDHRHRTLIEMSSNLRYLLNAIGENPLPGEFQLLMDKLKKNFSKTLQRKKEREKREKERKEKELADAENGECEKEGEERLSGHPNHMHEHNHNSHSYAHNNHSHSHNHNNHSYPHNNHSHSYPHNNHSHS